MTKAEVLQAWNVITAVINSSNLWSNNRQEAEQAASLLREAALKSVSGDPVGLGNTDVTAVTSAEIPHSLEGNIILSMKDGKADIQVYKLPIEQAALVLRVAATKF
jgi:hypothetical protein